MAKTNKIVTEGVQTDYTSVIVSYSNGIDSTGALYWALKEFSIDKIFLLYCDTGFEYPENVQMFYRTAAFLGIKPILLEHPKGFLNLLLEERLKWPDMKNRWCTAYLKTGITDKWIRSHRDILGTKCLFISGERRDESKGRLKLPEIEYHSTTLWTKQDVLRYVVENDLDICSVYGDIKQTPCGEYYLTGEQRTGCMFCAFGAHMESEPNRFQRMATTYPHQYNFCMKSVCEGGLGMAEVLDYVGIPWTTWEVQGQMSIADFPEVIPHNP